MPKNVRRSQCACRSDIRMSRYLRFFNSCESIIPDSPYLARGPVAVSIGFHRSVSPTRGCRRAPLARPPRIPPLKTKSEPASASADRECWQLVLRVVLPSIAAAPCELGQRLEIREQGAVRGRDRACLDLGFGQKLLQDSRLIAD